MIANIRVLIVDSVAAAAAQLAQDLVRYGYFCELSNSKAAAHHTLSHTACDLVVHSVHTSDDASFELLDEIKSAYPRLPVILLASDGATVKAIAAIKRGAFQYLVKPCSTEVLHRHMREALAINTASTQPSKPSEPLPWDHELVHVSATMRSLRDAVERVAMSSSPVLLLGESGSGKERIARAIHMRGPRRELTFLAVNATALPEHLLESELFGHVRGAFTGALHARAGLFAEAHRGTLLLDEIGDLPKTIQPKLLRVLQSGETRAVGSDRTRHVDVRIIAATHRDLVAMCETGLFRDDLRYRLNILSLRVPPLRERRDDIPLLVAQFLAAARKRAPTSPVVSIDEEALDLMVSARWLGNVRELEGTIERVVVMGKHARVTASDLSFLQTDAAHTPTSEPWSSTPEQQLTLRQMNHRYLSWVLAQTNGDKVRAAEILGIDVSTLYRWQRTKN